MEPEEIDKLFKDRFAGLPAMPSADAWSRLQQKMEPPKKERAVWMYYVAASVSILLVLGVLFFRNPAPINSGNQVAVTNQVKPKPIKKSRKIVPIQATEIQVATSTTTKAAETENAGKADIAKQPIIRVTKNQVMVAQVTKPVKQPAAKTVETKESAVPQTPELVAQQTPSPEPTVVPGALALNNPAQVIEVTVKRDNQDKVATAETEEVGLRDNLAKKGQLLKNIYKQARNLKNGERVELASLGINTEKLETEKNNIKEKLNKVISL